jgi:hypothetical protein
MILLYDTPHYEQPQRSLLQRSDAEDTMHAAGYFQRAAPLTIAWQAAVRRPSAWRGTSQLGPVLPAWQLCDAFVNDAAQ